ncbi:MAG: hypothetical protein ACXABY_02695 [Candidatus Thorarchaeota archaeon]|jgi:hypothetical protein
MGCSRSNKSLFEYLFGTDESARTIDIISSDNTVDVTKTVFVEKDQYDLGVAEIVPLDGYLNLELTTIQLTGNSVDCEMTWDWTKSGSPTSISSQELDSGGGYGIIDSALRYYDVTGLTGNTTLKVKADDGLGNGSDSTKELIDSVTFGNYIYYGELTEDLDGSGESNIVTKTKTLSTQIDRWSGTGSQTVFTFTGTGNATTPKYYYFAFPAGWDPNDYFEDAGYTTLAGFFQLGDGIRSGFFKIGEYNITNDASTPYQEAYTIWQSASNYLEDITYNVKYYGG